MSNNHFIKGECRHCAGHLEFPADAAGETVACPHCGQPTVLAAGTAEQKRTRLFWLGVLLTVVVMLNALAAVYFLTGQPAHQPPAETKPAAVPATPAPAAVPAPPPPPAYAEQTNEFGISPLKLETTPGSSLVYVTGTVRNLADRQRFGVKIEFQLLDTNDLAIGRATDYQSVLEPQGGWSFRALVMESKAVSARFSAISEQQ
jgi:hypothetical protein